MPTPEQLVKHINAIIAHLVKVGMASDQNFVFFRDLGDGRSEVTFTGADLLSVALKDREYTEIYSELQAERAFTVLMPDGALLQLTYLFNGPELERHRLAFFPSPFLEDFQSNPEIYLEDVMYAEVVARNIVPFPLRFDFDSREGVFQELHHPKSHLTLGQYENCRIPVTAPLMPEHFVDFVLRHFYHTAFLKHADDLPRFEGSFKESVLPSERSVIHVQVPVGVE
ncbi:MAG: DUF2290 domain-containing protein [Alicyclobacillus sp.]|nr:DUF2290 domain-containing protein [Alicyclobacillus sp.]